MSFFYPPAAISYNLHTQKKDIYHIHLKLKKILKILFVVLKDSIQDLIITFIRLLVVIISEVISVFSAICNDDNIINGIKLAVKDYIRAVHRLVLIIDSDIMFLEILILNAIFHLTYRSSYVTILFFIFTTIVY